jgi:vitamin B12 transporter
MFKNKKGFNVEVGGRWNHHNVYGNNFTYSFNPFYLINEHYKVYANLSSGYRVPSIYQLYSEYGNKNLKPEVTISFEAGAQLSSKKVKARITGFIRDGKDVFYFYTDPITYAGKYINADKQRDYGIETQALYRFSPKFSASFNYTFTNGKIVTGNADAKDTSYFNLYKRPKNVLNIFLNYHPTKDFFASANFKAASKAFEPQYMGPAYELKGYCTIGFYGEYKISKMFKVFADIENITDQQYFVTRGFTTKGFNFNGGIKAEF